VAASPRRELSTTREKKRRRPFSFVFFKRILSGENRALSLPVL
jgi:hypothetical protein